MTQSNNPRAILDRFHAAFRDGAPSPSALLEHVAARGEDMAAAEAILALSATAGPVAAVLALGELFRSVLSAADIRLKSGHAVEAMFSLLGTPAAGGDAGGFLIEHHDASSPAEHAAALVLGLDAYRSRALPAAFGEALDIETRAVVRTLAKLQADPSLDDATFADACASVGDRLRTLTRSAWPNLERAS